MHETPRVLVADPDHDAADTLAACLSLSRVTTRAVYDGKDALDVLHAWTPEGIVADIDLAHISGLDVARTVRREYGPSIRLVACTAWASTQDRTLALQAGFNAVVQKPAAPPDVMAALNPQLMALIVRARQATIAQLDLMIDLAESYLRLGRLQPRHVKVADQIADFVDIGLQRGTLVSADRERIYERVAGLRYRMMWAQKGPD